MNITKTPQPDKIPTPNFNINVETNKQQYVDNPEETTGIVTDNAPSKIRFRHLVLGIGSALVITIMLLSDPSNVAKYNLNIGAGTLVYLITLSGAVVFVGLLHICRKALIDYVDLELLFKKAIEQGQSGNALIAVSIMMLSIAVCINAATR